MSGNSPAPASAHVSGKDNNGELIAALEQALGSGSVISGAAVAERDNGFWDPSPLAAKGVLLPRNTEDVSKALKICHAFNQPVIAQGGKTGGVRGQDAQQQEVVLSLERMAAIEDIDVSGRTATVQAGCRLQQIQEAAEDNDLLFPLDMGSRGSCTIGGNIATNAGGMNVIRYGMTREQILGLEVVLADGTILSSMNQLMKNNTGYDLKQLFIGSEGTLGIVTRAVLRLREKTASVNVAMLAMESFDQVIGTLKCIDASLAGQLTAYEMMMGDYYRRVTEPGYYRAPLPREHPYYVIIESRGSNPSDDRGKFESLLEQAFQKGLISDAVLANSQKEINEIWTVREDISPLLEEKVYFTYDVSVPISRMKQYIDEVTTSIRELLPNALFYVLGHVGDCNLHLYIAPRATIADLKNQCAAFVYAPLKSFNGSVSAEHGIGIDKKSYLPISRNDEEIKLMRAFKTLLDPQNILARDRIISSQQ
jgi:FAD/FMN-containing dehydrogenase